MTPYTATDVEARLPPRLAALRKLAFNLRWSWDAPTRELFRRIDPLRWESSGHNPVLLLRQVPGERWAELRRDPPFLDDLDRAAAELDDYLADDGTWFTRHHRHAVPPAGIAYFSAEYGIAEALAIYSGGLGVLSGDHLKAASDLGIPLTGVGMFYREGYFSQALDPAGRQEERYPPARAADLPLTELRDEEGQPVSVELAFPERVVRARVWRAQVGRVPLYLLDTDVADNRPPDRDLTARLYGGDAETRLAQEIVLGIGGYRALRAAGVEVGALHMNEGHSSFLVLEHIRRLMRTEGLSFREARSAAGAAMVFTTHTPVSAGHDQFPRELTLRYLGQYTEELAIPEEELLGLARRPAREASDVFCMTCLALRTARHANGVSRLHGAVSRSMWQGLWPEREQGAIPIGHVTNGIHLETWLSEEAKRLFAERFGRIWTRVTDRPDFATRLDAIGDRTLWSLRNDARARLVEYARRRIAAGQGIAAAGGAGLREGALTIGFARRFTAYKRATLVLRDVERLARILNAADRPVQLFFAGKAHPRDERGKEMLMEVARLASEGPLAGRLVLLAGYDLGVARQLVQGVDVWLNTPSPPLEASGTSGMKAAANGALNLSTFDGWWAEAWDDHNRGLAPIGWVVGDPASGVEAADPDARDGVDAASLYRILEEEVVPAFYERDGDGLPRDWLSRVRASMGQLIPFFNTHRMLRDYTEAYYLPGLQRSRLAEGAAPGGRR